MGRRKLEVGVQVGAEVARILAFADCVKECLVEVNEAPPELNVWQNDNLLIYVSSPMMGSFMESPTKFKYSVSLAEMKPSAMYGA